MKTKIKALLTLLAAGAALISAIPAVMALEASEAPEALAVVKTVTLDRSVTFSADDFADRLENGDRLGGIFIASVPDRKDGMLLLSGEAVEAGQAVLASKIENMIFVPLAEGEITATFECIPIMKDGTAAEKMKVAVNLLEKENAAPAAADSETETRAGMRITGMLRAEDPEGAKLSFYIKDPPGKGDVQLDQNSGVFVYIPHIGKTGKDSFTFYATDQYGNISQTAKVQIKIGKSGKIVYSDMSGHYAHFSAVRLAEEEVLTGESIGDVRFFHPDRLVTRGEFVAMALTAAGMDKSMPAVLNTGLFDDDTIPAWLKSYVTQAIDTGIFSGSVNGKGYRVAEAERVITRGEAAVIINAVLEPRADSAAAVFADHDTIPVWAYTAASNMKNAGIMVGMSDGSLCQGRSLDRAQAAVILYNMMCCLKKNGEGALLSWAKN